jgi:hypothetical protein
MELRQPDPDKQPGADPIPLELGDKNERSQRTRLGHLVGTMRDRVFTVRDGDKDRPVQIQKPKKEDRHRNAQQWCLKPEGAR